MPASRLKLLAKGINLNNWLGPWAGQADYATDFGSVAAAFLKRAGFTVCRLPLAPDLLFDSAHPAIPKSSLAVVDRQVRLILNAGLAVILDPIHESSENAEWESRLYTDPSFRVAVDDYWEALARHFSAISADRIFFEIMNEPHLSAREKVDRSWWQAEQVEIAKAIRRGAPSNTIIATGESWGGIAGLLELAPLADHNVVYSFHFYDPMTFTHQGASWAGKIQEELAGIPYPSTPDNTSKIAAALPDEAARRQALRYGGEFWGEARIREDLARVSDWAKAHLVPVFCGEFGVYRKVAPAADRLRWIGDVRKSLEALGIGWSMWDYQTDFGLVVYSEPRWRRGISVDADCLSALGLDPTQTIVETGERPTIAAFASNAIRDIELPVEYWGRLWTRDKDTGSEKLIIGSSGLPAAIDLEVKDGRDWALATGFQIPLAVGETIELSSKADLVSGRLSMEVTTRDVSGQVLDWNLASVKAMIGTDAVLVTRFIVPSQVASVEARWSGMGSVKARLGNFVFKRIALAQPPAPSLPSAREGGRKDYFSISIPPKSR